MGIHTQLSNLCLVFILPSSVYLSLKREWRYELTPTIIWLSVISMTTELGDYQPIITPFKDEDVCNEKTLETVGIFEKQAENVGADRAFEWSCEWFQIPPRQYGF